MPLTTVHRRLATGESHYIHLAVNCRLLSIDMSFCLSLALIFVSQNFFFFFELNVGC